MSSKFSADQLKKICLFPPLKNSYMGNCIAFDIKPSFLKDVYKNIKE